MGSITFNSPDGHSRAHSHIFGEIRELKTLCSDDDDVMLSLSEGFFADYLWIAGPDRKYFAERIRSVLSAAPAGEWTHGGLQDWSGAESKAFAEHCSEVGMRVPGLHSIAEHLEANDEHPVVITHSVSAHYPTPEYADKNWLREAKRLHGEDYLEHFHELSEEEQWNLTMPRFMKKEAILQWKKPLSSVAKVLRKELQEKGLWRAAPQSVAEKEILGAKSWSEMKVVLESILERLKPKAAEFLGDEPSYVICPALDSMVIAEHFAKEQGNRLPGIAHVYMRVLFPAWRKEYQAIPYNRYVESSVIATPTVFLPLSIVAVADEVIQLIDMLDVRIVPSKVVVLTALANGPQLHMIKEHYANRSFDVIVHALEVVDNNLLETREHLSEMTHDSSVIQPQVSRWFWRRMTEAMKQEDEDVFAKADAFD
jgi:hypothetical protein